jgi:hypothetical protein
MKGLPLKYAKLAKRVDDLDAKINRKRRIVLRAIVDDGNEAEAMAKALAEHIASNPGDAGLTVCDFDWILRTIIDSRPSSSSGSVAQS